MRYLPFIERSIARLGYVKAEYATDLAILMEENEGSHPHQIARLFRQHGEPLDASSKRSLGIRANADMTAEALDALTQRGLSEPIKALELTLLDAAFSYFRQRSVDQAIAAGYDRFQVDGPFQAECPGCKRLNGSMADSSVLRKLPPPDCAREACAISLMLRIDFVEQLIREEAAEKLKSLLARILRR